jgi:hypothetical protein
VPPHADAAAAATRAQRLGRVPGATRAQRLGCVPGATRAQRLGRVPGATRAQCLARRASRAAGRRCRGVGGRPPSARAERGLIRPPLGPHPSKRQAASHPAHSGPYAGPTPPRPARRRVPRGRGPARAAGSPSLLHAPRAVRGVPPPVPPRRSPVRPRAPAPPWHVAQAFPGHGSKSALPSRPLAPPLLPPPQVQGPAGTPCRISGYSPASLRPAASRAGPSGHGAPAGGTPARPSRPGPRRRGWRRTRPLRPAGSGTAGSRPPAAPPAPPPNPQTPPPPAPPRRRSRRRRLARRRRRKSHFLLQRHRRRERLECAKWDGSERSAGEAMS